MGAGLCLLIVPLICVGAAHSTGSIDFIQAGWQGSPTSGGHLAGGDRSANGIEVVAARRGAIVAMSGDNQQSSTDSLPATDDEDDFYEGDAGNGEEVAEGSGEVDSMADSEEIRETEGRELMAAKGRKERPRARTPKQLGLATGAMLNLLQLTEETTSAKDPVKVCGTA